METYSRVGRTVVAAMLTGKTGKRGRGSLPPFSRADCPYFLPFLAPAFSPDFSAGLGAASFGLASGFFAIFFTYERTPNSIGAAESLRATRILRNENLLGF
jgi:hypothetical protein